MLCLPLQIPFNGAISLNLLCWTVCSCLAMQPLNMPCSPCTCPAALAPALQPWNMPYSPCTCQTHLWSLHAQCQQSRHFSPYTLLLDILHPSNPAVPRPLFLPYFPSHPLFLTPSPSPFSRIPQPPPPRPPYPYLLFPFSKVQHLTLPSRAIPTAMSKEVTQAGNKTLF